MRREQRAAGRESIGFLLAPTILNGTAAGMAKRHQHGEFQPEVAL